MESKEVLELIHKAKAGNNEATEKLIEQYLNAVRKINNKWGGIEDKNINNVDFENKTFVAKLLDCCTKQEKEVLNLLFFEGYSGQAVAEKLGMSRQWVHSMKHRAFEKIRNNIKSPRNF